MNARRPSAVGKRLAILSAAALAFALSAGVLSVWGFFAASRPRAVVVEVRSQEGCPLTVRPLGPAPSDPQQPVFNYEVINSGRRPVSAYAIRHDVTVGSSQTSGVTLTALRSSDALLYPSASSAEDFRGRRYGAEVSRVVLSVDLVEFADGGAWGDDTFKMSEKLAGTRAGGQAALRELRRTFAARGLSAVGEAVEGEIVIAPPTDQSELWKESFAEGGRIVRARLQSAKRKGGLPAVERELNRPFDALEGRR